MKAKKSRLQATQRDEWGKEKKYISRVRLSSSPPKEKRHPLGCLFLLARGAAGGHRRRYGKQKK